MSVNGAPALVSAANLFEGFAQVSASTTAFTITAADLTGNTMTQHFEVDTAGAAKVFTFDANGNMTSDGTRTFAWNARNQVVELTLGYQRTQLAYDGWRRLSTVTELVPGLPNRTRVYVSLDGQPGEIRGVAGLTRLYAQGYVKESLSRYSTHDHLQSVRESLDDVGQMRSRVDYDPTGRLGATGSEPQPPLTFGEYLSAGGVYAARYRFYDADIARWLTTDPIGWFGGSNFYTFANNNPISNVDPHGLTSCTRIRTIPLGGLPWGLITTRALSDWDVVGVPRPPLMTSELPWGVCDDVIGTIVDCFWSRKVEYSRNWRYFYLQEYDCVGNCGERWTEFRRDYKDRPWIWQDTQRRRNYVYIPILLDFFVEPDAACRRVGPPRY